MSQGKKIMATNQIAKRQTATNLIALYDKLKPAPAEKYAQMHAQGEKGLDGTAKTSLIGVVVNDYAMGVGEAATKVTFNLYPEQVGFVFSRIAACVEWFDFRHEKTFGDPDESGLCQAQAIAITRRPTTPEGYAAVEPWTVWVSNGRAAKEPKGNGGHRVAEGSYREEKSALVTMTDEEAYALFARADACVKAWERSQTEAFVKGREAYEAESAGRRAAARVATWQGGAAYGGAYAGAYGAPYGARPYGTPYGARPYGEPRAVSYGAAYGTTAENARAAAGAGTEA